jgi:hypothetical protein
MRILSKLEIDGGLPQLGEKNYQKEKNAANILLKRFDTCP